ncbi:GH36-type glycosyl hydrolase domain-containing protein [Lichenibacterium dinghuense]|uniref:GH36-type glycosyl hydrolase domain-containing protein n=1 Tax=Lichenibacterium dinghuense TaxID=2895977 RepID=UPI001F431599|nr:glycosyl transferase family 36 [Lichenibacterium sp. 6Y81]
MDQRTSANLALLQDPVARGPASRAAERLGCAVLLLAAFTALLEPLPAILAAPLAAGFGAGSLALARALAGVPNRGGAVLGDVVALGLFALVRDPAFTVWQLPTKWADVVGLTPAGAAASTLIYAGAGMAAAVQSGRDLAGRERGALLLLPLLFNFALSLGNGGMMHDLGSAWTLGIPVPEPVDLVAGRWLVLFVFCEVALGLCRILVAGRINRDGRYHALLLGAALHAVMGPHIADLPVMLGAAPGAQAVVAVAAAALAQSGLWAIVYIVTGLAIDALNGVPPTYATAYGQWRSGATKGLIYGGVFMAIIVAGAAVLELPGVVPLARAVPILPGLVGGTLLFPLALTAISSADGTPPFFGRLGRAYRTPRLFARGAVVGLGIALAFIWHLPQGTGIARFVAGLILGAVAYAGVDFAADAAGVARGTRRVMANWQSYALGAMLGGFVAGAIGWYFEAHQITVVATKFWSYADLGYAATGRPIQPFSIYPLFNKFGVIDLGPSGNGVRLFFNESLSGVINWGIAAPLFSINFFVLSAVFNRSLSPLKQLVSARGFVGLVEQAVRVLRWGLWMAPVINSFLRQSPDPAWYNQDGAVRTGAATVADLFMPAGSFKSWSLSVFTGLLAYDWLRVLIWFDHMGLRVATLVNLTFIGGDRLDEVAARFTGHAGRTRAIPEGVRRFATWAPLLIPFYIPHGADWDRAWTGAEAIGKTHPPVGAPVLSVVAVYLAAAFVAGLGARAVARAWNGPRFSGAPALPGVPRLLQRGGRLLSLANGAMTTEVGTDGRGYTAVTAMARGSHSIDVTRQPLDPLDLRGPFVFLRDAAEDAAHVGAWSLGYEPMRRAGPDYHVGQPDPASIVMRNTVDGICAEARIVHAEGRPLEYTRVVLTNAGDRPRTIELTSYRELAVHELGAYLRDPDFNALHVESWFVRELGAVLARNRLLRDPATHRMSHETVFHAALLGDGARLVAYEDSRTRFLGPGGYRAPRGLTPDGRRAPDDEGSLYTFDPAAALTVRVELAPKARAEVTLLTGRAVDEWEAARVIAAEAGRGAPDESAFRALLRRKRLIHPGPALPASTWPFDWADDTHLLLTPSTPRPWAHVMANPIGFGTVVSNEGEVHSFRGNERQNAITPFRLESGATTLPGQFIAVVDLATGEADAAGFVPFRRGDAVHAVEYRLGAATFTNRRGDLELSMTVFVFSDAPVDVRLLTIRNHGPAPKRFRVVPYMEIALDQAPGDSLGLLDALRDEGTEALLFENPRNDFQSGWAFAATSLTAAMTETVRSRFVGSPGRDLASAVMVETGWPDSDRADDGRRVAAFSGEVTVPAGGAVDVSVVLGQLATKREALTAASHLRDPAAARAALKATEAWWAERIGAIRVETDDPAFDRLVNHWLPYQSLASRLWGRTGPNQRGGAFGFRDQLQDVLPFLFSDPSLTRRQIVIHSGVQFPEGDVFKWWHLASDGRVGLGQRTRASDPHLWLPYVLTRYVEATGDWSVLDERQPYLVGDAVPDGAMDLLLAPRPSRETGDVYDHCRRAIRYTMDRMGAHGLPLIGTGDWNDGIDAAGPAGRGEGTWLACFFFDIVRRFAAVADHREGRAAGDLYRAEAERLAAAIDGVWTGDHYVFDFVDDGRPLDPPSIMAAAWPVLSGAAPLGRGRQTLEHGLGALEKPERILLVTPPFDEGSEPYPGRIADYPPGVRENGGQYSHGASWAVDAWVAIADRAREDGDGAGADAAMARAVQCWRAISPLGKTEGDQLGIYGLAPHQQPADVYDGESYGGRGGWSWYTGSAARMLSAAYAILGLRMENGHIHVPDDLHRPRGDLRIRRLWVKGELREAAEEVEEAV